MTASGLGCPAAGKTGTTDNNNDAWFVGYTPHLSTAVWLGYPDALISTGQQGGGTPTSIWTTYMSAAKGDECDDFPEPSEPFESSPFFGEYSSTGTDSDYSYDPSYGVTPEEDTEQKEDTGGTDPNSGGGTDAYDPRLYEAPPQEAPNAQPKPPPPGQVAPPGQEGVPPGQQGGDEPE